MSRILDPTSGILDPTSRILVPTSRILKTDPFSWESRTFRDADSPGFQLLDRIFSNFEIPKISRMSIFYLLPSIPQRFECQMHGGTQQKRSRCKRGDNHRYQRPNICIRLIERRLQKQNRNSRILNSRLHSDRRHVFWLPFCEECRETTEHESTPRKCQTTDQSGSGEHSEHVEIRDRAECDDENHDEDDEWTHQKTCSRCPLGFPLFDGNSDEKNGCPKKYNHAGIITNEQIVEMNVIVTDKLRFPSRRSVQKLEAPPPGEHPVTKSPRAIEYNPRGMKMA
ncbi:hypothetical protein GCK72_016112 [Caenorhabditis remanei]|uniref:Uncharacterized protein n=1 Tax=Caenorhabditis remanei TaxID=31234 RepID=A0A6A5GYL1_CAERE|nr:hypothetical protein GCK72_016112 [Caenorhabditis remanei]KAF1759645.1 hypothetical protein GCK72_016112 [Caenorhabditis remanei]